MSIHITSWLKCLLFVSGLQAQTIDSLVFNESLLLYHKIETKVSPKKGVLIFMHGGVSQFKELPHPKEISPEAIIERNPDFLPLAQSLGYDIILPIAFNEYNWMEDAGHRFVLALVNQHKNSDGQTVISGFSDGGTGAYQIFYSHPESFDAVLIFNGYPQHRNFYRKVDYTKVTDKHILFASTKGDKRIPYEFLLTEYRRQKIVNQNTFFHLAEGGHSFSDYTREDFEAYFSAIERPITKLPQANVMDIYPPIDGWMIGDTLLEVYPFRKAAVKKYGMAKSEYERSDYDFDELKDKLHKTGVFISPVYIKSETLKSSPLLYFQILEGNERTEMKFNNWLIMDSWE